MLIVQESEMGCGIACVASVAGTSYESALRYFDQTRVDCEGFYCRDLVFAFSKLGLDFNYKYSSKKLRHRIYINGTIVFIKRSKKYPHGHYLARFKNVWMDPWINYPNENRKAGYRKRLPGKPIYVIFRG